MRVVRGACHQESAAAVRTGSVTPPCEAHRYRGRGVTRAARSLPDLHTPRDEGISRPNRCSSNARRMQIIALRANPGLRNQIHLTGEPLP